MTVEKARLSLNRFNWELMNYFQQLINFARLCNDSLFVLVSFEIMQKASHYVHFVLNCISPEDQAVLVLVLVWWVLAWSTGTSWHQWTDWRVDRAGRDDCSCRTRVWDGSDQHKSWSMIEAASLAPWSTLPIRPTSLSSWASGRQKCWRCCCSSGCSIARNPSLKKPDLSLKSPFCQK